jgi:hypothetical protein
MVLAVAALLTTAACERADDLAIKPPSGALNLEHCLPATAVGPIIPVNGCLMSPNMAFALIVQANGTLVVGPVAPGGTVGAPIWTGKGTGRAAKPNGAWLRNDGDLLLITMNGSPIWDSRSYGFPDEYRATVSDIGAVTVTSSKGVVVWSSRPDTAGCATGLDSPATIASGACLVSPHQKYVVSMAQAGSLVVAKAQGQAGGETVWSTGSRSAANGAASAAIGQDGALVISENGAPLWTSQATGPAARYHLALGDDGALVINNQKGATIWSSPVIAPGGG